MSIPTNFFSRRVRFLSGLFSSLLLLTLALSHASGSGCCKLKIDVSPDKVTLNRIEFPIKEIPAYLKRLKEHFGESATKDAAVVFEKSTPVSRILEIVEVFRSAECPIPTLFITSENENWTPISIDLEKTLKLNFPQELLSHDPHRTTSPAPVDPPRP